MQGYYRSDEPCMSSGISTGKLKIEVTNIPEFKKLILQAEKEADQLNKTINQLQHFELNINFSVLDTTSCE